MSAWWPQRLQLTIARARCGSAFVAWPASPRSARADSATYTETVTATGTLGGQSFTNALVTLTAMGDTSNVNLAGAPVSAHIPVPVDLTIAGLGSTAFTDVTWVVSNTGGGGVIGMTDITTNFAIMTPLEVLFWLIDERHVAHRFRLRVQHDTMPVRQGDRGVIGMTDITTNFAIMTTLSSALQTFYNLQSSFGPVSGNAGFNSGKAFGTADGDLVFTAASDATFQAVVTPSIAATPEPASLALLGTGLLVFAGVARRRSARCCS